MASATDLARNLQEELAFHRTLSEVVNQIHSATSIDDILINATDAIRQLLQCERLTIYAIDVDSQELYSMVKIEDMPQTIRLPKNGNSISGFCAMSRRQVNIKDVYDDAELAAIHPDLKFDKRWDSLSGFRTRQTLATPIAFGSHLLGVLQMINKVSHSEFTANDQKAADQIARTLAIAFFNQMRATRTQTRPQSKYSQLVQQGILSKADLDAALAFAERHRFDPATVLLQRYRVSKESLLKALAAFFDCPWFSFDGSQTIPEELQHRLDPEFWRLNKAVPLERKPGLLSVAVVDPCDANNINAIRGAGLAPRLQVHVALEQDILGLLDKTFPRAEVASDEPRVEQILTELAADEQDEAGQQEGAALDAALNETDSAIVRLASKIIFDAYRGGVSDIHVEPYGNAEPCVIRFRRDGDCFKYQEVPAAHRQALVSRLKIMAQLDIAERRRPQDGKIKIKTPEGETIELRVATIPTAGPGNEDVVMRILAASKPLPLEEIGMSPENYKRFREIIEKPYGLVLCVGPTGSGKTTTLHSALGHLNKPDTKIWTVEDPVEITQKGARQVQVNPKVGFTFAAAMRSFLRADPDIIMLGEMRDSETAAIGIEAALTGHLVLSTLHTNTAPETITRLLDMGLDPFNFSTAFLGVLAQRLARTLCKKCKDAYVPDEAEFQTLVDAYGPDRFSRLGIHDRRKLELFRAAGCENCDMSGYRGRIGLHELLVVTDPIRAMIVRKAPVDEVRQAAIAEGMTTLMQDGIRKVIEGHTDLRQVRAVCMR